MKPIVRTLVALVLLGLFVAASADAMFMHMEENIPLADILKSVEKKVADDPKDAHAQYLLGRVHSMAWAQDGNQLKFASDKQGMPEFMPYASVRVSHDVKATSAEALKHLDLSIVAYRKAVELDPKNGLYHLGLAWMMEQKLATAVAAPATQNTDKSLPPVDRKAELKAVIDEYVKAFDLRLEEDKTKENRLMAGDAFVSAEAAEDAIRLLQTIGPVDNALVKRLEDGKTAVMSLPFAETPIVVAMNEHAALKDLIDPAASVSFDLAGPGRLWPWITKDAGLLVWDPAGTGQITSGRQLFGPMTWHMRFSDGYEALSMLDRNRDGQLSGDELKSIALWRDANANGVSDAGEVVPLDKVGITAINVIATNDSAGVLQIPRGIHWTDGHTTASFDWVPQSK